MEAKNKTVSDKIEETNKKVADIKLTEEKNQAKSEDDKNKLS